FVAPSLIRASKKERQERQQQIDATLSKSLQNRVDELEKTVQTLLGELTQAKNLLTNQTTSPPQSLMDSPALAVESNSPPVPFNAFFSEEVLLDLAFPSTNAPLSFPPSSVSGSIADKPSPPVSNHSSSTHTSPMVSFNDTASAHGSTQTTVWLSAVENAFQTSLSFDTPEAMNLLSGDDASLSDLFASVEDSPVVQLLESDEERDMLLARFFDIATRHIIPIVHEACFWKKLRSPTPPSRSLILVMCAIALSAEKAQDGSLWGSNIFTNPGRYPRADACMNAAILALDLNNPCMESCQAVVLMVIVQTALTDPQTSVEWLLIGMAMRMVAPLRLDVDPDVLELMDPTGRKWTWVEKEVRRRVFALICLFDEVDMIFREACFGVWKRKNSVKLPSVHDVWKSVDPATGEPTVDPTKVYPLDAPQMTLMIFNLRCRIAELNTAVGLGYTVMQEHLKIKVDEVEIAGVPAEREPTKLEIAPELQFALIDAEMDLWFQSMPPGLHPSSLVNEIQFTYTFTGKHKGDPNYFPPYSALKLHFFHMAGNLALHRPILVKLLKSFSAGDPICDNGPMRVDPMGPASIGVSARAVTFSPQVQLSLRKCAEASVGITQLMKRKVMIVYPSRHPTRLRPFASYLQLSAGYAMPLLEAGLMNAMFLTVLGVGAGMPSISKAIASKVADAISGIIGDTYKVAALEGLCTVLHVLRVLSKKRKRVEVLLMTLEKVVAKMGLTDYVHDITQLEDYEDLAD
ncbi:hypothetical protein HK101_009418, partial [Irineochytrium annulatum]